MLKLIFALILLPIYIFSPLQDELKKTAFKTNSGKITFKSDAPLETIYAESTDLRGIIDTSKNTFAFSVAIISFTGFNGPLQKEHFNENYMESDLYPVATFTGKIIEEIDYSAKGIYEVRAKGVLNIHGVKQERIIKGKVEVNKDQIVIKSEFIITMADHDIRIPKIVYQKIAPDIDVTINASLTSTSK
ncbi:MAG TPA: YceI family protein [Bacteroidia bacterium]|nr:YceI family protein [Bacteroidia bacterium]